HPGHAVSAPDLGVADGDEDVAVGIGDGDVEVPDEAGRGVDEGAGDGAGVAAIDVVDGGAGEIVHATQGFGWARGWAVEPCHVVPPPLPGVQGAFLDTTGPVRVSCESGPVMPAPDSAGRTAVDVGFDSAACAPR